MSETDAVRAEVDALLALVRERYGSRLTAEELDAVRTGITGVVEAAHALRKVWLDNADEPGQPFTPYRTDG